MVNDLACLLFCLKFFTLLVFNIHLVLDTLHVANKIKL